MSTTAKVADRVPKKELPLKCGHKVRYRVSPPKLGEDAYCYRCEDWREVITAKRYRRLYP
jgi:hypothetical protein